MLENVAMECVICQLPIVEKTEKFSTLYKKGAETLVASGVQCEIGQHVHSECRNKLSKNIRQDSQQSKRSREETVNCFDFKSSCLFCGTLVSSTSDSDPSFEVRTLTFQHRIKTTALNRKDDWGDAVYNRIDSVIDLPAADACYHQSCNVNFRTSRSVPQKYTDNPKRKSLGRPADINRQVAFYKVIDWLENNNNDNVTVHMLIDAMKQYLEEKEEAYSYRHMIKKLEQHYGDEITFHQYAGNKTVITLQMKAADIIASFYKHQRSDTAESEKQRIIQTAAQLILDDIKSMTACKVGNEYPPLHHISLEHSNYVVPNSLQLFLGNVIREKHNLTKISAIAQAIMQAARPRTLMMPLQLGLAVHLHDHFASKYLIDTLSQLGFCKSYTEVRCYERNAAVAFNQYQLDIQNHHSMQYMADNVDDDPANLDGRDTIHYMGMTVAVSPFIQANHRCIPRSDVQNDQLKNLSSNLVQPFNSEGLKQLNGMTFNKFTLSPHHDKHTYLDLLWKCKQLIFRDSPLWNGLMHTAFGKSENIHKSSVVFLPMIDLPPTDPTCVYSMLKYIEKQSREYDKVPVCTFDQALWWKALQVLSSPKCDIGPFIIRLGGFHTLMSFLGCYGYIMSNSGLSEAFELVYAAQTVPHLLSGKAINRALRAHLLTDLSLNTLLLRDVFNSLEVDVIVMQNFMKKVVKGELDLDKIHSSDTIRHVEEALTQRKLSLEDNRTARLWLQYLEMNDILKQFIRSERLGNWNLHLSSLSKMLPYFAACGHNNYAKSVWLYLQQMSNLERDNTSVYHEFVQGFHVVRRTEGRVWAGLSPDLVIEQTLMRSLKATGGLTRGTGFKVVQRNTYLFSRPACAEVSTAIQELTGKLYSTREQHIEMSLTRISRDNEDCEKLISFFEEHNPFTGPNELRNIGSGVNASPDVNVDTVITVGTKIIENMDSKTVSEFSFKSSWKAVNMSQKVKVANRNEIDYVDSALLFQRLIAIASNNEKIDLSNLFEYELSPYPASLFQTTTTMRKANKPKLFEDLHSVSSTDYSKICESQNNEMFVLDGGNLLYKIKWEKQKTFAEICASYIQYVRKQYGGESRIVFDGYPMTPTTKDQTHAERTKGTGIGPKINFSATTPLTVAKALFLSNLTNKQAFINLLADSFRENGIDVICAKEDADLLIAKTAIECSKIGPTVVIGEDTDLLVLLCHYASPDNHTIVFQTQNRRWKIEDLIEKTGNLKAIILLAHAFLGCDTVSQIYGIAKNKILKCQKLLSLCYDVSDVFYNSAATKEQVEKAGEKLLLGIYNKKGIQCINILRQKVFMEKVAGTTVVKPESLPPTKDSARQHSYRVFHQIQAWLGNPPDATKWGWKEVESKLVPVMMTQPAAPDSLLSYIRCGCKEDGCRTTSCSCKKHGISCSLSCTKCNGVSCHNPQNTEISSDADELE